MNRKKRFSFSGRLKGLFCAGLAAALMGGIALNTTAASASLTTYDIKVDSSSTHTLALAEGSLYFWGTNSRQQAPGLEASYSAAPVQLLDHVADMAVSSRRSLIVLDNGELRSYGTDPVTGETSPAEGTLIAKDAVQVDAADGFAAYISKGGDLYAWGKNDCYQLGNGSNIDSAEPVLVMSGNIQKVSLGKNFALALLEDGTVYGWGANDFRQLSAETPAHFTTPAKIAENVSDIAAGAVHTCLLKKDGSLWTCGDNTFDQTGAKDSYSLPVGLTKVLTGIRSISAGTYHSLAAGPDGSVYAWGYGLSGQLGTGDILRVSTPQQMKYNFVQVFACNDNTFGISPDGSIFSFGEATNYRLAQVLGDDSLSPEIILDKDMNWTYEESMEAGSITHGADGDDSSAVSGSAGASADESDAAEETEDAAEEEKEPEVISTVFVSGDGTGSFHPNRDVTRAEFLRMVVSAVCKDFDAEKDYGSPSFSDIEVGRWYENYVAYAELNKIITGDGTGYFHPQNPITKADAAVIVSKAMKLDVDNYIPSKFKDVATDRYFTKPIDALNSFGIFNGDGTGNVYPFKNITRAEAVTVVALAANFTPTDAEKTAYRKDFPTAPFSDVEVSKWYYPYLLRGVGYVDGTEYD